MCLLNKGFLRKCVEDRKRRNEKPTGKVLLKSKISDLLGTIATLRDHAYLFIDFIDAVMCC